MQINEDSKLEMNLSKFVEFGEENIWIISNVMSRTDLIPHIELLKVVSGTPAKCFQKTKLTSRECKCTSSLSKPFPNIPKYI